MPKNFIKTLPKGIKRGHLGTDPVDLRPGFELFCLILTSSSFSSYRYDTTGPVHVECQDRNRGKFLRTLDLRLAQQRALRDFFARFVTSLHSADVACLCE